MNTTKNQQLNQKPTITKVLKIATIWLSVFIIASIILTVLINRLISSENINGPNIDRYIEYLENKYGKSEEFYYIDEPGGCSWFETGTCARKFSSKKLNGQSFYVNATNNSGSYYFTDDYLEIADPD